VDARAAAPTHLPFETLEQLADDISREGPGIASITCRTAKKPLSTIEAGQGPAGPFNGSIRSGRIS